MDANKGRSEEKYPLLYVVVDKDTTPTNNNGKFFERRSGIARGAQTVLEQWPGYMSTCWLTSLISVVALISMFLLLITALSTYKLHRLPRCVRGENPLLNSTTVHLVHGPSPWDSRQLETMAKIVQYFPRNRVHLIAIRKPFEENATTGRKLMMETEPSDKFPLGKRDAAFGWPFFDVKDFVGAFLDKNRIESGRRFAAEKSVMTNISDLLAKYPQIFVETLSYEEAFARSPLLYTWHHLNEETKLFAIRVLQLWEYGGVSFDVAINRTGSDAASPPTNPILVTTAGVSINEQPDDDDVQKKTFDDPTDRVDALLALGRANFAIIPRGVVTLAENGCHMETKTPCHAFFGEILRLLRAADMTTRPEGVIADALKTFMGSLQRNYRTRA